MKMFLLSSVLILIGACIPRSYTIEVEKVVATPTVQIDIVATVQAEKFIISNSLDVVTDQLQYLQKKYDKIKILSDNVARDVQIIQILGSLSDDPEIVKEDWNKILKFVKNDRLLYALAENIPSLIDDVISSFYSEELYEAVYNYNLSARQFFVALIDDMVENSQKLEAIFEEKKE
mgnify:CR=1 FL=1